MSPRNGPGAGLDALLRYIEGRRDASLATIRGKAAAEAKALTRAARARAHEEIRRALREAREDADARLSLARAQAQAHVRQARHALTARALDGIERQIARALLERWWDSAARGRWVAAALADAQRHLPLGTWVVTHPEGWKPEQCRGCFDELHAGRAGITVQFSADAGIEAGLRISSGDVELDATVAGLLRAPARIAGLWLAELERARRRAAPEAAP